MGKLFSKFGEQIKEYYRSLSPMQRTSISAAIFIFTVAFGIIFVMVSGKSFVPLLTNVPIENLPLIVAKLSEKQVPHKVIDGGKTIAVPPDFLHSTQMMLMSESGLENLGSVGFELFNKEDFATNTFHQRVNFQRALQGELSRTIMSLGEVKSAKVILAMPNKKTFLEEGSDPSASVVIELRDNKALKVDQVRGIIHLVASAVEGMDPSKVTVVDSRGKVLSRNLAGGASAQSNELMEFKTQREQALESRIEDILGKVVGQGKVIARVNADVNFRTISSVEEIIDPEKQAVKAMQVEEEKLSGNRNSTAGVPGARSNLPGAEDPNQNGFKQDVNKELKTTNFENTKTTRTIKEPMGAVTRLTIAVLVDGTFEMAKDKDGKEQEKWVPRTPEEMQKFDLIVKNAIGFDDKRGDSLKVDNIKFQKEDFSEAERFMSSLERRKLFNSIFKWAIIAISFGIFVFFVIRPFTRWISYSFQDTVEDVLPKTIEELEDLQSTDNTLPGMNNALPSVEESVDPDKAESELLRERIMNYVGNDPKKVAFALNQWITERR